MIATRCACGLARRSHCIVPSLPDDRDMWRMYMLRSKLPGQALKDHTAKDRLEWQQVARVGGIPHPALNSPGLLNGTSSPRSWSMNEGSQR